MSESVTKILKDLNFDIEHDWIEVVHAMQRIKNGDWFSILVDVKRQTFSLKCCAELIEQHIIIRQGFDNAEDLKNALLKNKVFTQYQFATEEVDPVLIQPFRSPADTKTFRQDE